MGSAIESLRCGHTHYMFIAGPSYSLGCYLLLSGWFPWLTYSPTILVIDIGVQFICPKGLFEYFVSKSFLTLIINNPTTTAPYTLASFKRTIGSNAENSLTVRQSN